MSWEKKAGPWMEGSWGEIRAQDVKWERREVEYAAFSLVNVEEWDQCQKYI